MHLVYTENQDTKHIIDLQKVLITSFDGKQLTIILTLVGGIAVHIKAKDKDIFMNLYEELIHGTDDIQIGYEKVQVRLGGIRLE